MAETSSSSQKQLPSDAEQRERLISKEQEGLVESITKPDGAKPSAPEGRFTGPLIFAVLACVFGSSFQFGYHIGNTNIPGDIIKAWINESYIKSMGSPIEDIETLWGLSNSLFTIGGMIGGICVGTVADLVGRRNGLLYNNAFAAIGAALMTFAKPIGTFYLYFIGRFVIGLNSGLASGLAPMYLVEISPMNLRGSIGSLNQLFITIAILVAQFMGLPFIFGTVDLWPLLFAFSAVPLIFQLCTLPLCAESPKYTLIVKGNKDKAESDLIRFRGDSDVQAELEVINEEAEANRTQAKVSIGAMFRAPLLWPLVLAMFMMLSQQWSGINAAMFYSKSIFEGAGLTPEWTNYATLLMGLVNVTMTVISVYLVERLGRRTLHLTGLLGTCVTTALICVSIALATRVKFAFASFLSIVFVQLFVISFAIGPGSIPWFYVSEVFPSNARGNANSLAVLTNWGANTVVVFAFPVIQKAIKEFVFLIFTGMLVVFIGFAYKFLPETKNKSLEEVQAEMDRLRGVTSSSSTSTSSRKGAGASTNV